MFTAALGLNGAFSSPHRLAALAGRDALIEGGSAIEAMVAAAAVIAVAYPHMNGLGGDAFWLIERPEEAPIGISGAGRAAGLATLEAYRAGGRKIVPPRGPEATLLVPGAVASWELALELAGGRRLSLERLLAPAIAYAEDGIATTASQSALTATRAAELAGVRGFAETFLIDGRAPRVGERFRQPALGQLLRRLARDGLDDFYRGAIAREHAEYLEAAGSPLRVADFAAYRAERVTPLSVAISAGRLYNLPPPTQGIASLLILGIFDRLGVREAEGFAHVHGLVEATKQAYRLRNRHLGDPQRMTERPTDWLEPAFLDRLAGAIDPARALPWPESGSPGGTVWLGAVDRDGTMASFIQSLFWEFGSGLTSPTTGVVFENRGAGFSLRPGPNELGPGRQPAHTLNPALAHLSDGRRMVYGNMGGEGQPQTQSAVFSRYAMFGEGLQQAITAPRWLLGRTWGDVNTRLKLESRFATDLLPALVAAGHDVEMVGPFEATMMGHAGAVVRHPSGTVEAAADPRADGGAIAF